MMQERNVDVDALTIFCWVPCYTPELEKRVRWYQDIAPDPDSSMKPTSASAASGGTCFQQSTSLAHIPKPSIVCSVKGN